MLRQYVAAKQAEPDALLLFRMGDFYELFFDDAKVAAEVLDLTLTARDKGPNPVPMAGVPHHAIEGYIARLVARGHRVAICEQMQDPRLAKGLVERAVTRVVTPATVSDLGALPADEATLLAAAIAIAPTDPTTPVAHGQAQIAAAPRSPRGAAPRDHYALAAFDMLSGELLITVAARSDLLSECVGLGVRELVCAPPLADDVRRACREGEAALSVVALADAALPGTQPNAGPGRSPATFSLTSPQDLSAAPSYARSALHDSVQALLTYAQRTQRRPMPHVKAAKWYAHAHHLGMDLATRRHLELFATACDGQVGGSLFAHLNRTRTAMGARTLRRWLGFPSRRMDVILRRQAAVAALVPARQERELLREALRPVRDIARLSGRIALGRALPRDLQQLGTSLQALAAVQQALCTFAAGPDTALRAVARARLPTDVGARLEAVLHPECSNAVGDGGVFNAGHDASYDELTVLGDHAEQWLVEHEAALRTQHQLPSLKVRYNRVFGYYVELPRAQADKAPSHFVRKQTTANHERFATAELEQFAVRAAQAREQRGAREMQLYAALTTELMGSLPAMQHAAAMVGQLDALQALAEVADRHRYCQPTLTDKPVLQLEQARHPTLECLMPRGESFVANDIALHEEGQRLIVLTGPNMAGKSTLMRQSALCVVLAQMGSFVPCASATIGLCDHLFLRVGASDNIGRGQSTFMVEMVETAAILRGATRHSLVVVDEVGRGTATYDGLAIAWAVAECLHNVIGARTLFATHYHELCELQNSLTHVVNQHLAVHEDRGHIAFLRSLRDGPATRSYGVHVARLARLPSSVVARATSLLHEFEARGAAAAKERGRAPQRASAADAAPERSLLAMPATNAPDAPPTPAAESGAANERAAPPHAAPARPQRAHRGQPAEAPAASALPLPLQLALARLRPDDMSPRDALAALYDLKAAWEDASGSTRSASREP